MQLILKLVLLIFVVECKEFRYDYSYSSEADGWFKLHRVPAVWREARLRCKLEGAVLASPSNYHMYVGLRMFMKAEQAHPCGVFTGVHATFSKGDFFSIDGVALNKMPVQWLPDEPNNLDNNEDCIRFQANGSIADVSCAKQYPYICYKKNSKSLELNGCGTVDKEYSLEPKTGSCYKFHRTARTWSRAYMTCAAEGGYLAIINSQQEASVLQQLFEKNPPKTILQVNRPLMRDIAHLGFHDWGERGDWTTIHGDSLVETGYNIWAGNQPDNDTGVEFCGGMFRNGQLDDVWCEEIGPFICEMTPDSLNKKNDDAEGVLLFLRYGS